METIEKLRKAWKIAPPGAKTIVYKDFSQQNVSDILKNGRTDDKILEDLLKAIKTASAQIAEEVNKQNDQIQKI